MKFKKAFAVMAACLLAGCAVAATGCGDKGGAKKGELIIRYFESGYGDQWLKNAKAAFEESHEGITVKLEGDTQVSSLMAQQLSSGKNVADIYMVLEAPWREYVSLGYLASLESVFETEVTTSNLGKVKIKDYLLDDISDRCYATRYEGAAALPYIMPWAYTQVGIVYNEDVLLATEHGSAKEGVWAKGDKWTAPPATVDDLVAYCADLTAAGKTPFSFAGNEPMWLQRLMYGWWGQYQGAYEPNTANSDVAEDAGAFFDFFNYKSADVFNQAGIEKAIEAFQKIFVDTQSKQLKNVVDSVMSYSTQDAERAFAEQKAAMVVGGAFIYNELGTMRDLNADGKDDFTMKLMSLPLVEGAQLGNDGDALQMNYYNCEDMMFVPAKAVNLDLAKEFLAFLSEEASVIDFVRCSGTVRPYQCVLDTEAYDYSPFVRSEIEIYNTNDVSLIRYPSKTPYAEVAPMYSYVEPLWSDAYGKLIPDITSGVAPSNILKSIHDGAVKEWNSWLLKSI